MHGVVTLGAGIAGLSFSYHFNHLTEIYEKEGSWGGHCRSHSTEGFTFDRGIHISFTKDDYVRKLFAASVADQYGEFSPVVYSVFASHWVRHPVETNLKGLPAELVAQCLIDFIRAEQNRDRPAGNYREWLISSFGRTFAERFHSVYSRKYWTVDPEYLTTEWVAQRIYRPTLEEVLRGALSDQFCNVYYIDSFRYPAKGGYQSFLRLMAAEAVIRYGFELVELDLKNKKLIFSNGFQRYYDTLVSSIPLPELIRCIKDLPAEVKEAASRLAHTSVVLVNLGVKKGDLAKCHWFYVYDEDFLPARVHFSSNLSGSNAPPGCTGIQAEIYHSTFKPLKVPAPDVMERAIENLIEIGILAKDDDIILTDYQDLQYANVIYDRNYRKNRELILDFLEKNHIYCIGRYGEWAYLWSDQSLLSGKRVAEKLGGDTF